MAGRSPSFRRVTVPLNALQERDVNVSGAIAVILEADGSCEMAFDSDDFFEIEAGLKFTPFDPKETDQTFKTLRFRETSGLANTIVLQIGTGDIDDNRAVFGKSELPVKTNPGTVLDVMPDAAAVFTTQKKTPTDFYSTGATIAAGGTYAAGVAFDWAKVTNLGTETLRVQNGAASGVALPPGETMDLPPSPNAYIYNPNAISVNIGFTRVRYT